VGLVVNLGQTSSSIDDYLTIGSTAEVLTSDRTVVLTNLSTYRNTTPCGLLNLEVVHTVNE
jgi:hypothetical protein